MKITKKELIELKACKGGLNRFITQTNNTDEPVEVSSLVGGENTYDDLLWLAGKKLPKERIVRFACDCALLNVERIKPYTDKYDEIVEFLRNPTIGDAATRAVSHAVYGDGIGDDAANYAVRTVIRAAIRAAYAAANAANAAYAANAVDNKEEVNNLLRELFA